MNPLAEPFEIGGVRAANRLVLAPLAGIGNWFVRLQARRHGAGLVVSEMVSSFGLHHGNQRTLREFLTIHPEEHPVSVQLFGSDPDVMAHAAEIVARAGADLIDLNMGCPVRKVCRTGAGAALLAEPDRAVAVARAARAGGGLPVTVKLRPGLRPGDRDGMDLAHRLVDEAGVAAINFHPRHASQEHGGRPDYGLARELAGALPVPVVLSGGMRSPDRIRERYAETGVAAVMLARGSLGNPWLFEELLDRRTQPPTPREVADELGWIMDRATEHLGPERAARYLRKFYPWYLERLDAGPAERDAFQRAGTLGEARTALDELVRPAAAAA